MYDREAFAAEFDVPRETLAKLDLYAALLREWQGRMNLVGRSTLASVWERHFRDSAQLIGLAHLRHVSPPWLDIGSGAGFPGLIIALLSGQSVHLVESIRKKVAFLDEVVHQLGLQPIVSVHNCRIEALGPFRAGAVTSRACASLPQLFEWSLPFAGSATTWLLLKGWTAEAEIASARSVFTFVPELVQSRSDPSGRVIVATQVKRRRRQ